MHISMLHVCLGRNRPIVNEESVAKQVVLLDGLDKGSSPLPYTGKVTDLRGTDEDRDVLKPGQDRSDCRCRDIARQVLVFYVDESTRTENGPYPDVLYGYL